MLKFSVREGTHKKFFFRVRTTKFRSLVVKIKIFKKMLTLGNDLKWIQEIITFFG